jgi:hypothetical protein
MHAFVYAPTQKYPPFLHDMKCRQVRDFGSNTGNPYRTFELYLERHLPAVGHAHFDWQPFDETKEVQMGAGNFDAIFNAFHRDALDSLLVRRIPAPTHTHQPKQTKFGFATLTLMQRQLTARYPHLVEPPILCMLYTYM